MITNILHVTALWFSAMWKMLLAMISDRGVPLTPQITRLSHREEARYCYCLIGWTFVWLRERRSMTLRPFFRLDTMVRTWATAPSARGSSWFCGWRESSLQWPPSTWGSRCPSSGRKHFLSIWPRGLFTQNSIKTSNEREFEKFLSVTQTISHPGLSQGVLPRSVCSRGQREEPFWPKVYKELSVAFKQTPPLIGSICLCFSGSLLGEQIRSGNFVKDANNWVIQNAHTAGPSNRRPLPGPCVFRAKPTANDEIINQMCFFWCRHFIFTTNSFSLFKRLNQWCFNELIGITKWHVSSPSPASFLLRPLQEAGRAQGPRPRDKPSFPPLQWRPQDRLHQNRGVSRTNAGPAQVIVLLTW